MSKLSIEESKHLVIRTSFGPCFSQINSISQLTKKQAVEEILKAPCDFMIERPKLFSDEDFRRMRRSKEKKRANVAFNKDAQKIKSWAIEQILANPNELQERMTWFWHNHFTSSVVVSTRSVEWVFNQSLLIRGNAIGNFSDLLRMVAYDPLMLVYLDGVTNIKGDPNENFSRELLELFTLGEGYYNELDVKEVARAFTGWRIKANANKSTKVSELYDNGTKVIFNKVGEFDSDDVITMLLDHPRTAMFIAEKIWYEFVSIDKPERSTIVEWANSFRSSGYDIKTLLREVFLSDVFWDIKYRATLIKSPLDFILGTLKVLELEDKKFTSKMIAVQLRRMGQNLYTPPNVKGWKVGEGWVDDFTLLVRHQFIRQLLHNSGELYMSGENKIIISIGKVKAYSSGKNLLFEDLVSWLLAMPPVVTSKTKDSRKILLSLFLDPAYQLK